MEVDHTQPETSMPIAESGEDVRAWVEAHTAERRKLRETRKNLEDQVRVVNERIYEIDEMLDQWRELLAKEV